MIISVGSFLALISLNCGEVLLVVESFEPEP
jgi:hypothetical protein